MNEQELRTKIASRLRAGMLPSELPAKTFAGTGEGTICDCCGVAITDRDVQYEVDFATPAGSSLRTIVAHRECHRIWHGLVETAASRRRARRDSRPMSTGI